jgi:hypothetical protein
MGNRNDHLVSDSHDKVDAGVWSHVVAASTSADPSVQPVVLCQ